VLLVTPIMERIAAAPITWGVDGSPGWGVLMPRDRVFSEMRSLGISATELGPDGYLPTDPDELQGYLETRGLRVVGGWVPVTMARQDMFEAQLDYLRRTCHQFQRAGAEVLILGPMSHLNGYDVRIGLTTEGWNTFFANLSTAMKIAQSYGLTTSLHQHMGTAIETNADLQRVLDNTDVKLCVDTGHLLAAGIDPVTLIKRSPERVAHVHLKDISNTLAGRIRRGELPFRQAVLDGLFRPLGQGDVDLPGVINTLEAAGYAGWYAIEQDCALSELPPPGSGPVRDCEVSYAYLKNLTSAVTPIEDERLHSGVEKIT
jgi:inosose dehydratase